VAKRNRIGKQDAVHAEGNRSLDVWFQVVDVNNVSGIDSVIVKEQQENARIGLEQAHFAGKLDSLKPSQEVESP